MELSQFIAALLSDVASKDISSEDSRPFELLEKVKKAYQSYHKALTHVSYVSDKKGLSEASELRRLDFQAFYYALVSKNILDRMQKLKPISY